MRSLLIALAAILVFSSATAETVPPEQLAHQFYAWVLTEKGAGSGLPTSTQRAELVKYLSSELIQLLDKAVAMEKKCISNNTSGDKPHIVEGNILVGNYEGASEVIVGQPHKVDGNVVMESRLFMIDPRFPKSHQHRVHSWTDELVLSRDHNHKWVISNIRYKPNSSLLGFLREYLEHGAQTCNAAGTSFLPATGPLVRTLVG